MNNIFTKATIPLITLPLLTACMVNPVSITRQQQIDWRTQPLTIQASYNELLAHHLRISFNNEPVIDASLGNPNFPEYSEENYKKTVYFNPLTGFWNNQPVRIDCHKGPWNGLLNHPKCQVKINQQTVVRFDFNQH